MFTTQVQIRVAFWHQYPQFKRVTGFTQNQYSTSTRTNFCQFIEDLQRSNIISEALAFRATL